MRNNAHGDSARLSPNPRLWRVYRPLVWLFAAASLVGWSSLIPTIDIPTVAGLIVVANIADLFAVRIRAGMRVSTNHFATAFALASTGVAGALIVAIGCNAGRLLLNRRDWNTFDVAVGMSAASFAGMLWLGLQTASPESVRDTLVGAFVVVMVFAMFRATLNYGWTLEARSKGIMVPEVASQIGKLQFAAASMFPPAVAVYNVSIGEDLAAAALAMVLPFAATQYMVRAFGRERDLNQDIEETSLSMTESLVNALDARDEYSAGHSVAVAVYARDIAIEVGLTPEDVERIYLAGLLHDIGKIAVPDRILKKPGALTNKEFDEIKKHPIVGEEILAPSRRFRQLLPAVRSHHERLDGRGYPDGLTGSNIPLDARIVAIADAYNAMTSSRPYRDAMKPKLAVRILDQNRGMQHDPFLVAAFQRVLEQRDDDYAVGAGPGFATTGFLQDLVRKHWETKGLPSPADPPVELEPTDEPDEQAA